MPSPPSNPPLTPGVSGTVLIVDDERGVLSAMKRALSRFGFEVLADESAESALARLEGLAQAEDAAGRAAAPQVILSDHRMTNMDGVSFLTHVKERWPAIQRVLITGFADLEAIERAVNEAGIYRFVNKPWDELSLLGTVRSAVEQWQAVDENQRLLRELAGHNRRLEEAVEARTRELTEALNREREAARQLALTDRLAAIGQLAGGVAHELNNPLSGILAFAQLMLRDPGATLDKDKDEQRDFLREIESAALRCKKIVEHLLRFSRQAEHDEIGRINLNTLVHEALPLIEHQYALRGVRVICRLDPRLPDVRASGARLQQVLMNLLSNAFDATSKDRDRGAGPGQIEVTTLSRGQEVLLVVRDQGAGIDERSQQNLFLPFFSTKPEGRGTGLGLAVAYGIVTDHGGTIQARNVPEGGAEFTVTLQR